MKKKRITESTPNTIQNLKDLQTKGCVGTDFKLVKNPTNQEPVLYKKTEKGNWVFVYEDLTVEAIDPTTKKVIKTSKITCEGYNNTTPGDEAKDKFIDDLIKYNKDYVKDAPSDYEVGRKYEKIDLSTLNKELFKPKERFIYKRISSINTKIEQQPEIERMLEEVGYTLTTPAITSSLYDERVDISKIMGGKYKNFYKQLGGSGEPIYIYPTQKLPEQDKKTCKTKIDTLYGYLDKRSDIDDKDLMTLKREIWACQKHKVDLGTFGGNAKEKLDTLLQDYSKYGLGEFLRNQQSMYENKLLNKVIKENLIQKKKEVITETTIVKNRFKLLSESQKPKTKKEIRKFVNTLISETAILNQQGIDPEVINEGLFDFIRGMFGSSGEGILSYFKEQFAEWLLGKFGLDRKTFMGNIIVTGLGNLPITDLGKLTNCEFLTDFIAKSVTEGIARKFMVDKNSTGPFAEIIRNTMAETFTKTDFVHDIEQKVNSFICPALSKVGFNMDKQLDTIKQKALS